MTVLVTGAAGFLGANIVRALACLSPVRTVLAGRRRAGGLIAGNAPDRLDLLAGTGMASLLLDVEWPTERLTAVLRDHGVDAIVHCAAYGVDYDQSDFETALRVNAGGTDRLVQAASAADVTRFVQVGTGHEYGELPSPIAESACPRPRGIYGVAKLAATAIALERARLLGLSLCVLRPFGMYGPLEGAHKFVPMVMRASREGQDVALSPGGQRRDYCYVGDVAAAITNVLDNRAFPTGAIINLASGHAVALRTLADAAVAAVDGDPARLRWGERPYRADDSMLIEADVAQAALLLGWQARTTLAEGMALTAGFEHLRGAGR